MNSLAKPSQSLITLPAKLMARARGVIKDGAWVFLGQMISAVGALVGVRALTEFIAPDVFGAVSLYLGIILLGTNLACAPLFQSILRFYPEMAATNRVASLRTVVRRMLWKSMLLLFAGMLIVATVHSLLVGRFIWIYLPVSAVLAVDTLRGLDTNFLSAARKHRPFAIWNAFEACCRPLGAIAAVLIWNAGAEAVLTGYAATSLIGYFLFRIRKGSEDSRVPVQAPLHEEEQMQQQISRYALPLVPLAVVVWVSSLSDRYVIGGLLDLEKVGVYAAAYGLVSRPFLILGNITTLTLRPIYFEAFSRNDSSLTRKILGSWVWLTAVLAAIGVLGFVLLNGRLSSLLLSQKYRLSSPLMPWIAVGYGFYILANVFEQAIYARKETGKLLKMHMTIASFALITSAVGVWSLGLPGAAFACPVYFLFHLALAALLAAPWKRDEQSSACVSSLKLPFARRASN